MEYVYKEPKVTGLTEICERLQTMYTEKFGKGKVRLIMDSGKVRHRSLVTSRRLVSMMSILRCGMN